MTDREPSNTKSLSRLQAKFVDNWRGNPLKAAVQAGYQNPQTAARRLMNNQAVIVAIKRKTEQWIMNSAERKYFLVEQICQEEVKTEFQPLLDLLAKLGNGCSQAQAGEPFRRIQQMLQFLVPLKTLARLARCAAKGTSILAVDGSNLVAEKNLAVKSSRLRLLSGLERASINGSER